MLHAVVRGLIELGLGIGLTLTLTLDLIVTLTLTLTLTQVRGCWLLSPEWLLSSLDSGRFLPEARRYRDRARG